MQKRIATVVIVTKNRKESLRRAIDSALAQSGPVEVIVIDDASTDGTAEMVSSEYRTVVFHRSPESLGYIVQRNRAAKLSSGEIIVSIDDDAEFSSCHVVERTVADFCHDRIGAVAIPYVEPNKGTDVFQHAPDIENIWVTDSFRGTAYALRRDLFVALHGYREHFVHQGEEMDYCIRLLQSGFVTRLGSADVIYHYESSKRDNPKLAYYGRRNDVLFAGHNVPFRSLPLHLIATTLNGLRTAIRGPHPDQMLLGALAGYRDLISYRDQRAPVSGAIYRLYRWLKKKGPLRLQDIEGALPLANSRQPNNATAKSATS